MAHLVCAGEVQGRLPGRSRRRDRGEFIGVQKLPDVMAAISMAECACEHRPIGGFADIVVVQIAIGGIETFGMVFIARFGV